MGRRRTKTGFFILAGVMGLITAIVILLNSGVKPVPTAKTVVAVSTIHRGEVLKDAMLTVKDVPLTELAGRSPVTLDAVRGKVARVEIIVSDPGKDVLIDPSQLRPPFFSNRVSPGKRAVSVAVDAVISVGGFAQPGDHVDVVATYDRSDQPFTQTILQDVELLAVGPDVQSPKGKSEAETSQPDRKTAVLSVYPGQAQLLALWENHGKLRLVLRNPDDSTIVKVDPTVPPWRAENPPPPRPQNQTRDGTVTVTEDKKPSPAAPTTIEVFRGSSRTLDPVGNSKG